VADSLGVLKPAGVFSGMLDPGSALDRRSAERHGRGSHKTVILAGRRTRSKLMLHTCGRWTLNFVMITLLHDPRSGTSRTGLSGCGFRPDVRVIRVFFYVLLHFSVYLLLDQSGKLGALWQDIAKRALHHPIGMLGLLLVDSLGGHVHQQGTSVAWGRRWNASAPPGLPDRHPRRLGTSGGR